MSVFGATGFAYTQHLIPNGNTGYLVTSTATSTLSQENAQMTADSIAQNDANLIDQSLTTGDELYYEPLNTQVDTLNTQVDKLDASVNAISNQLYWSVGNLGVTGITGDTGFLGDTGYTGYTGATGGIYTNNVVGVFTNQPTDTFYLQFTEYWNQQSGFTGLNYQQAVLDVSGNIAANEYVNNGGQLNTNFGYGNLQNVVNNPDLFADCAGWFNVTFGSLNLLSNTRGYANLAAGAANLISNLTGSGNIAVGFENMIGNTSGNNNIAVGIGNLFGGSRGDNNIAIGTDILNGDNNGSNIGIGINILNGDNNGGNIGIGIRTLERCQGYDNLGIGNGIGAGNNLTGNSNIGIGNSTLYSMEDGNYNIGIGYNAYSTNNYSNSVALGANAQVSGSNQIRLGAPNVDVYGNFQIPSDLRDKADVQDTRLGLTFIEKLRPVDYRYDYRASYVDYEKEVVPINENTRNAFQSTLETLNQNTGGLLNYGSWMNKVGLLSDSISKKTNEVLKPLAKDKDGSRKRNRFHHGLIAQELRDTMNELGVDFGGYQDHSVNGGDDVLTLGYTELIAPLIKSVQELSAKVNDLSGKIKTN